MKQYSLLGVLEYWVIDYMATKVEVYTLNQEKTFELKETKEFKKLQGEKGNPNENLLSLRSFPHIIFFKKKPTNYYTNVRSWFFFSY